MNSFLETFRHRACDTSAAPLGHPRAYTAALPTRPWVSLVGRARGVLLGSLLSVSTAVGAPAFFADAALTQPGLVGSYVNRSLRGVLATNDWRVTQQISGTRTDTNLVFTSTTWGARAPLGLTGGTSARWADFSVQWDGYARIDQAGDRFATVSNEGSRMWIDQNHNGTFEADEVLDNHWGRFSWGRVGDWTSPLPVGTYRVRFQHYYESGDNEFRIATPAFIPRRFVPGPGNPVQVVKVIVLNFSPRIPSEGIRGISWLSWCELEGAMRKKSACESLACIPERAVDRGSHRCASVVASLRCATPEGRAW